MFASVYLPVCLFVLYEEDYAIRFQAIFKKFCRTVGYCCERISLNFVVHPTENG